MCIYPKVGVGILYYMQTATFKASLKHSIRHRFAAIACFETCTEFSIIKETNNNNDGGCKVPYVPFGMRMHTCILARNISGARWVARWVRVLVVQRYGYTVTRTIQQRTL